MSVINTNVNSLVAQNAVTVNARSLSRAMEQLSTGKRINGPFDFSSNDRSDPRP
jgi:flagellin